MKKSVSTAKTLPKTVHSKVDSALSLSEIAKAEVLSKESVAAQFNLDCPVAQRTTRM
jgi:hypothetical protein